MEPKHPRSPDIDMRPNVASALLQRRTIQLNAIRCNGLQISGGGLLRSLKYPNNLRKQLDIPPEIAKAFVRDMKAFFKARDQLARDETAAGTGWILQNHMPRGTKLGITEVKEMFYQERSGLMFGGRLQMRSFPMLALSVFALGLISPVEAQAKCTCQCINGWIQSVCSSPGDTVPATCPRAACPVASPTVLPIQPPQLPPPGTSSAPRR